MQDTELVGRGFEGTGQVPLSLSDLSHNGVITQLSLFSLSHVGDLLLNTEVVSLHLQPGLREVIAQPPKRLQFASHAGLELLHGVSHRDVIERTQIIPKLGKVLAHKCGPVGGIPEAGQQNVENALIANPVRKVNAHDLTHLGTIGDRLFGVLTHSHSKEVHVLLILVGLGDGSTQKRGHPAHTEVKTSKIETLDCAVELVGGGSRLSHLLVVLIAAGNDPLNFRGERRKAVAHLLHFIRKGFHSSGKVSHLPGELVDVGLIQLLDHAGELAKLVDEGCQIGFPQLRQRPKPRHQRGDLVSVRPFDIVQSGTQRIELVGDRAGNLHLTDFVEAFQLSCESGQFIRVSQPAQGSIESGELLGGGAKSTDTAAGGCFQPFQRRSQSVKTLYGLCTILLNLELQALNFHIISHASHHRSSSKTSRLG